MPSPKITITATDSATLQAGASFPVRVLNTSAKLGWQDLTCVVYDNGPLRETQTIRNDPLVMVTMMLAGAMRGHCKYHQKTHRFDLGKEGFAVIPASFEGECFWSTPYQSLQVILADHVLCDVAERTLPKGPACIELKPNVGTVDPLMHSWALALVSELDNAGWLGQLYVDSLTQLLAVHLLRNYAVFPRAGAPNNYSLSQKALHRAQDYIQAHLTRELKLEELAKEVGFTSHHLTRLFKRFTGRPLHQYVIEKRVEAACRLMDAGQLSLKAIAAQVGFADQSHFTRHFKRLMGGTPAQYLKERKSVLRWRKDVQDDAEENA